MRTEQGIIESTDNQRATVRIERTSACAHCDSRDACRVMGGKAEVIEVPNPFNAKVGDRVEIGVPTGTYLKFTLMVYFLPVVALIIGAFLGKAWGPSLGLASPLADVFGGGLFMVLTFLVLKRFDQAVKKNKDYQPYMTRILLSARHPSPDGSK